jgi:hypothetical protein
MDLAALRELHRTIDPKAVIANVAKRNVRGACLKDSAIARSCDCFATLRFARNDNWVLLFVEVSNCE